MEAKTRKTVQEAKRLLNLRSYDAAHDLAHHESVYATAKDIAAHITEPYDPHLLEIACLWHDVISQDYAEIEHKTVTQDTADYLKLNMLSNDFTPEQAETARLAVLHHEFDDKPVNTEGKLLFDADKLDTLNLERARRFLASDRAGNIPPWKLKAYIKGAITVVKLSRNRLHFDYSRQLFDKIIDELWDNQEVAGYAKKYHVDVDAIKRSLRRTTLLDRGLAFIKKR